ELLCLLARMFTSMLKVTSVSKIGIERIGVAALSSVVIAPFIGFKQTLEAIAVSKFYSYHGSSVAEVHVLPILRPSRHNRHRHCVIGCDRRCYAYSKTVRASRSQITAARDRRECIRLRCNVQIAHAQQREIAADSCRRARMRLADEILARRERRHQRNAEH